MSERGIELSDTVAQLVADARRQEGMSMDELAERAGVHRTYIGLLERRSRQPTLAVAANLAEALGLSLAELVGRAEEDESAPHFATPHRVSSRNSRQRPQQTRLGPDQVDRVQSGASRHPPDRKAPRVEKGRTPR